MSDLISRQAAIEAVRSYMADNEIEDSDWHADGIAYDIKRLPSAEPKPHYCRECKWSRCRINIDKHGETETYWHCLNWDGGTDEEGFCYEWEMRTDEDN